MEFILLTSNAMPRVITFSRHNNSFDQQIKHCDVVKIRVEFYCRRKYCTNQNKQICLEYYASFFPSHDNKIKSERYVDSFNKHFKNLLVLWRIWNSNKSTFHTSFRIRSTFSFIHLFQFFLTAFFNFSRCARRASS